MAPRRARPGRRGRGHIADAGGGRCRHDISTPEGGEALGTDGPRHLGARRHRREQRRHRPSAHGLQPRGRRVGRHDLPAPISPARSRSAGPACAGGAPSTRRGGGYGRLVNTSTGLLLYGGAGQSNYVAARRELPRHRRSDGDGALRRHSQHVMPSARCSPTSAGASTTPSRGGAPDPPSPCTSPRWSATSVAGGRLALGQCFQVGAGWSSTSARGIITRPSATTGAYARARTEIPRLFGAGAAPTAAGLAGAVPENR
jgi:hypothetical protein